jgi:SAM-dependent methyltransferase
VPRRSQLIPWQVAGQVTDRQQSVEEVVQATGWVFNNETGDALNLADFVASGDAEVSLYLDAFGLGTDHDAQRAIVEIGSGIGRMTCAFTRRFGTVYACDLDAGFLERCREAVARFGQVYRLRTVPVPDGRNLDIANDAADVSFSYITLQHCSRRDAHALVDEALRVVRPGGLVALNFRTRSWTDLVLLPTGVVVRGLLNVPGLGPWLSRRRSPARLAWQVNRMDPHQVLGPLAGRVTRVVIWRNPRRTAPLFGVGDAELRYLDAVNRAHWWLVATKDRREPSG